MSCGRLHDRTKRRVLDHVARHGETTTLADAFTDAKYCPSRPAVGSWLADHMVESVRSCTPRHVALRHVELRHVEKVLAVASSKPLSRRLALALSRSLGLQPPDQTDLTWNRLAALVKSIPVIERRWHLKDAMSAAPIEVGAVLLVDDAVQSMAMGTRSARSSTPTSTSSQRCDTLLRRSHR